MIDRIDYTFDRMGNAKNYHQGEAKRVLCVCSAGLLRSPTIAKVLSDPPYEYNTRSAGAVPHYALVPIDDVLIHWADEIVFAEAYHYNITCERGFDLTGKHCIVLDIPDRYARMDPKLIELIRTNYEERQR